MKKATLKQQVKDTFRTYEFAEAMRRTENERKQLLHIMSEKQIYLMCKMTSEYANK